MNFGRSLPRQWGVFPKHSAARTNGHGDDGARSIVVSFAMILSQSKIGKLTQRTPNYFKAFN